MMHELKQTAGNNLETASTRRRYEVTAADLPLSCPMPDMRLWDAHPRVYLPIAEEGHVTCPYCDAEYFLKIEQSK